MQGDVRLPHKPIGSAAFLVHGPKSDKARAQIRVFNDAYVIEMLQMLRNEHRRQLTDTSGYSVTSETMILERLICSDLTYAPTTKLSKRRQTTSAFLIHA